MADPAMIIERGHLYVDNVLINEAMFELYHPIESNNGHWMIDSIPPIQKINKIFESHLSPFLDPYHNEGFTQEDVRGLIINIVLYDALVDESIGLEQEIPDWYQPSHLLELIGRARGFHVNHDSDESNDLHTELYAVAIDQTHGRGASRHYTHIFHWASERLLRYFANQLGVDVVLESRTMDGNSYLSSYIESAPFRILDPYFVEELLTNGFNPSEKNNRGETPLHSIVYMSNDFFAHPTETWRTKSPEMHRYKQFYRSMIVLFKDPRANIDIKNSSGSTVRQLLYEERKQRHVNLMNDWNLNGPNETPPDYKNAREAHQIAIGRPLAVEEARKKIVNAPLRKRMGSDVMNRIWNMADTNKERQRAAKEKKQRNNMTRRKMLMHHELLNRASSKYSGGRRTLHAKKRGT
jgi:hypothetical protein